MFIPVINVLCQAVLQNLFGGNFGLCNNKVAATNEAAESSEVEMLSAQTELGYGSKWIYFPDGNLQPQKAYLEDPDFPSDANATGRSFGMEYLISEADLENIKFYLYNQDNLKTPIQMRIPNDLSKTGFIMDDEFDSDLLTKIIIHGWKSSATSEIGQLIKDAYLEEDDMNVILVDWSAIAEKNFYLLPAHHTKDVGKHVARLIDFMVNNEETDLDDIHLIGHSLGAHTAGYAGQFTRSGKVSRITGLDPALPGFKRPNGTNSRLDPSDAKFVDVIHTCAGTLGHDENLGHVDFYPNRGKQPQPGCSVDVVGACSHGKSYHYFADSIGDDGKDYEGYHCSNWVSFKAGTCEQKPVRMGDKTPRTARGMFFLETE